MALVAIRVCDGAEMEAFALSSEEWRTLQRQPLGTFVMPGTSWPAILKTSIRGLQFFAHAPGYVGSNPEPETEEHRAAKLSIVLALRSAGFTAKVEQPGKTPNGHEWQADVLCVIDGQPLAFEVQVSQQTLEEYRSRTQRYLDSGVRSIWLVRAPGHFKALSKALFYDALKAGTPAQVRPAFAKQDLPVFPLEFEHRKEEPVPEIRTVG